MPSLADIPPYLLDCDRKQDFLLYLAALPVDPMTKKELLFLWRDATGCDVSFSDLAFLGIEGNRTNGTD